MIHYFYGTLQVGIGQTLCSFEHVSCFLYFSAIFWHIIFPHEFGTEVQEQFFAVFSRSCERTYDLFPREGVRCHPILSIWHHRSMSIILGRNIPQGIWNHCVHRPPRLVLFVPAVPCKNLQLDYASAYHARDTVVLLVWPTRYAVVTE